VNVTSLGKFSAKPIRSVQGHLLARSDDSEFDAGLRLNLSNIDGLWARDCRSFCIENSRPII
jgi:hypothetical protein